MTSSLQPLLTLLEQAERERDAAFAAHGHALEAQRQAEAQAAQLVAYRGEYEQHWRERFRTDGRVELLHCYRGFMDRLEQALAQQASAAAQAAGRTEAARVALAASEMRLGAVRKLVERRRREQQASAERQEQKQTDEFAARRAWNHPGASFGTGPLRQPA